MEIKTLFDTNKDIYRTIEKVITYSASQEQRLKAEISEYIVTESIEEQFERLLGKMQQPWKRAARTKSASGCPASMAQVKARSPSISAWRWMTNVTIDGTPFIQHLQDRMKKRQTKALLSTVAKRFPGRGGHAGPGQRNAGRRHDGRGLHGALLQGAAVGRLFAKPQGGGLRAQA